MMNTGEELRIGILCSGLRLPHWQAQCIRHLLGERGVRIVAVGLPPAEGAGRGGPLHAIHTRLGELLFPRTRTREDVSGTLDGIPVLRVKPSAGEMMHAMGTHGAQAVLSLLPGRPELSAGRQATPLWWFSFAGEFLDEHGLPGFRSWMLRPVPSKVTLASSTGHRTEGSFSGTGTLGGADVDAMLLGSAWLPVQMSRTVRQGLPADPVPMPEELKPESLAGSLLHLLRVEMRSIFSIKPRTTTPGEWNLGIYPHPIAALLDENGSTNVRWVTSPSAGSSRAEPFGYHAADGQLNVLYRKNDGLRGEGVIARIRPKNDGVLKRSRTMLTTTGALGYPFVVTRPDGVYVVVSYTHQQRTELFRVSDTNDALDHVRTILDKAVTHPTMVEHGGLWWLFGTDHDAPDGVLRAWYSHAFEGPYHPHAMDPLRMSGSRCRPAGTFFVHDGSLWRPSLDDLNPDGSGVIFNRVVELTPDRFHEEAVRTLEGFPGTLYGHGIRTVCSLGGITLVDGFLQTAEMREMDVQERSPTRKAKAYEE